MTYVKSIINHCPPSLLANLENGLKSLNKRKRKGNIAMLHAGRCGSSVIGDMLNQHPDIIWASEIFDQCSGKLSQNRVKTVLLSRMYQSKCTFFGFETKSLPELHLRADCINMTLPDYINFLHERNFNYFIVLKRKNYVRRAISASVGRSTNKWHTKSTSKEASKVRIDPSNFPIGNTSKPLVQHFQELDNLYKELSILLKHERVLELSYEEDILKDPNIAYDKICEFVEVEPFSPTIRLKRTNPFKMEQLVENLSEINTILQGTQYEWMLVDEDS